jgi:hypothetical protein
VSGNKSSRWRAHVVHTPEEAIPYVVPGRQGGAVPDRPAVDVVRQVAARQEGVVDRRQALSVGLTSSALGRLIAAGRWQSVFPGVSAVHDQPVGELARVWAAVLYVGRGGAPALASGVAALWLAGVVDECPAVLEVTTSATRRVRRQVGLRVRVRAAVVAHPTLQPPRQRLEDALLDVIGGATRPDRVVDLVLRAGQRRLTTADRLRVAAEERPRLRWRELVNAMCAELGAGVHSVLERRYRRDVELAHGLPRGTRNEAELVDGSRWYRDVRYRGWRVLVELDGRGAHPVEEAFRDRRRDNRATRAGDLSLRYGWREVVGAPCGVAAEVAAVLQGQGWTGRPRPCGPDCRVHVASAKTSSR